MRDIYSILILVMVIIKPRIQLNNNHNLQKMHKRKKISNEQLSNFNFKNKMMLLKIILKEKFNVNLH